MLALTLLLLAQQPCTQDVTCGEPRLCVREPDEGPTCHAKCNEPRAPAQRCTVLEPPDDESKPPHLRRFVWTRDRDRLCKTCERDADCGLMLDRCVQLINGERACARDCTWNDDCPKNFVCADPGGADGKVKRRQCVPVSGCCHCDVGFTRDEGGTVSPSSTPGGATTNAPSGGWQPKPPPPQNWGPPARWSQTTPTAPTGGTPTTSTPPPPVKPQPRPSTSTATQTNRAPPPKPQRD